jgi:hypothetical protein
MKGSEAPYNATGFRFYAMNNKLLPICWMEQHTITMSMYYTVFFMCQFLNNPDYMTTHIYHYLWYVKP